MRQGLLRQLFHRGLIPYFADGTSVLLAEEPQAPSVPGKTCKWIHVATEGTRKGHPMGEFTLDRKVFEQMIANFRADPRYKQDPATGLGMTKVVPFDYEHASELDPTKGSIPMSGAGAPAWCMDLEIRQAEDGKVQLWSWTKLGKTIETQLENEEYAYTSIAFSGDATDPDSGKPVGARISSIAFTNTPFIRELEAIAASAKLLGNALNFYAYPAKDMADALAQLRELYAMPLGTAIEVVIAEAEKSLEMAKQGTAPTGVPIDDLTAALRTIFGVSVTSTLDDIGVALGKARESLVGSASGKPVEAPGSPSPSVEPTRASQETAPMALSELHKKIARIILGSKFQLRSVTLLASDEDVEKAVEETVTAATDLQSVLSALGVSDANSALEGVGQLKNAKAQLEQALAQLNEQMAVVAQVDQAQAGADVGAALSAKGWDASTKDALTLHRERFISDEVKKLGDKPETKKLLGAKEAGRKAFLTHYGVPDASHAHLLSLVTVQPSGGDRPVVPEVVTPPSDKELPTLLTADGKKIIEVRAEDTGRNNTERLLSAMRRQDPSFRNRSNIDQLSVVHSLKRNPAVVIQGLAVEA